MTSLGIDKGIIKGGATLSCSLGFSNTNPRVYEALMSSFILWFDPWGFPFGGGRRDSLGAPLLSALTLNMPKQSLISDSSCIILPGRGSPTDSWADPQLISGLFSSQLFIACPLIFPALVVRQTRRGAQEEPPKDNVLELVLEDKWVGVLQAKKVPEGLGWACCRRTDSRTVRGGTWLAGDGLVFTLGSRSGCDWKSGGH